jgi:hypothetical protein
MQKQKFLMCDYVIKTHNLESTHKILYIYNMQ